MESFMQKSVSKEDESCNSESCNTHLNNYYINNSINKPYESSLIINSQDYHKVVSKLRGFFLSKMLTLLTATVTISAPEDLIASAVSLKFLYFPVPTINLELSFLFAILKISFFN